MHGRIVLVGLMIGLIYCPIWLGKMTHTTLQGSSTVLLNLGCLYLGATTLWTQRHTVLSWTSNRGDRLLGSGLILASAAAFLVGWSSISLQALTTMLILTGIAWSSWGIRFFKSFGFAGALVLVSLYPDYLFLSNSLWKLLTPPDLLERFMAESSKSILLAMGQTAVTEGRFVYLPTGAVEIGSGCSGFDMAFVIAGTGVLLGLFMHLSRIKTLMLVGVGVALALVFNIPRVLLLIFAVVYWGDESFEFWHGPWGGQIFASLLFTAYYYVAMGMINWRSHPQAA